MAPTFREDFRESLLRLVSALAESLGFDVAWLAEIHFGGAFSLISNPLMVVPAIAQRTRRIRIGTAVALLPLHHPLSCAEQAATADLLSGGVVELDYLVEFKHCRRRAAAAAPPRARASARCADGLR